MAADSNDGNTKPETGNGLDRRTMLLSGASLFALSAVAGVGSAEAADQPKPAAAPAASGGQPNILFIMGDDIGWFNIGAYNRGMMAGKTPNLDKLASEGTLFQSYYAEASCTAGRANFITGELPMRTGLTTVGQAGATVGMPDKAPTIATVLKTMGYTTGQFGKNHLGDRNEYLPTVHGFDEFWGYLYHLDAMEDPFHPNYPQKLKDEVGPRNLLHTFAIDTDDQTVDPRWGKVGKQKITDEGPLPPHPIDGIKYNMETVDEVIRDKTIDFIDKAKAAGKPFFVWYNPTRMHVVTHLSPKYEGMRNSENGWSIEEAGMAQMDDCVGAVLQHLEDEGLADNTIVVFTTDNGAENFTWPDGGQTPFAGGKGTALEGGFRVPCILRWPRQGAGRSDRQQHHLRARLVPDLRGRGRQSQHRRGAARRQGPRRARTTRCISTATTSSTSSPASAPSKRNEIFYFTETTLGAVRIGDYKYRFTDQPEGWLGNTVKVDWPILTNLRLDPFERTGMPEKGGGSMNFAEWYTYEFWRFVFVQQEVGKFAQSFIDFPPMQAAASFNMEAVKQQIEAAIKARQGN